MFNEKIKESVVREMVSNGVGRYKIASHFGIGESQARRLIKYVKENPRPIVIKDNLISWLNQVVDQWTCGKVTGFSMENTLEDIMFYDELDIIELAMMIEDEFGFEIYDEEFIKEFTSDSKIVNLLTFISYKIVDFKEEPEVCKEQKSYSWNAGNNFINCYVDGEIFTADKSHPNFVKAFEVLIHENDVEKAIELISIKRSIEKYTNGNIEILGNVLNYKGIRLDTNMTRRVIELRNEGKPFEHLVEFLKNLVLNPRREAVYELFDFLKHNDIEITKDGYFLAYKKVRGDYLDIRSSTFDNSPGMSPEMEPFEVDDDRMEECSSGLHVCAKSYLPHYGSAHGNRVVLVKVNPAHVVAIPLGYDHAKLRCWKYDVLKDVTNEI